MDPLAFSFSPPAPSADFLRRDAHRSPTSPSSSTSPSRARPSLHASSSSSSATFRQPKVYGEPEMSLPDPTPYLSSSSSGPSGKGKEKEGGEGRMYLRVKITGLERNRKDLLIRFDASTNLHNFRTGMYRNMQRSYVEFQKFAEQAQLTSPQSEFSFSEDGNVDSNEGKGKGKKADYPAAIIPALPLASTSATTDEEDDRLVRIALQRWLTRICEDPAILVDEELRSFIESDFGYSPTPPPTARRSTSAASAVPLVFTAALSKVVRRGPLDEDDELASAKGALDKLESTWGGAAAAINNLGKLRRAHALANQEVGAKLINLSTVESDVHLAAAERKAGRALETLAGVAGAQTASENVVLSDSLGYQALNARAAKEALLQRTQLLEDAQTSSKSSITKRRNVERLKGSSRIDPSKVDDAITEMEDAEALEQQLTRQLSAISTNLHLSLRQHSRNTHEDVALALLENARLTVGFHKHMLRELEAVRPELGRVSGVVEGYAAAQTPSTRTRMAAAAGDQGMRSGMGTSISQPHMTGSRPYDSPPSSSSTVRTPPQQTRAAQVGSQSMFLPPPPSGGNRAVIPTQQQPKTQTTASPDPLGGHMAQSMVLPPGHRPAAAAPGRTQGRRLDERQAAKLLSGGF